MSYENIQILHPNFCIGPQTGTICTIDTTNPQTVMRVKSTAGSTVIDLSLSSNIINSNIRLEYAGPRNISELKDNLTFFTFEKVSDSSCIIKRWQTRILTRELLLKETIVKISSGEEKYNVIDFAVEYYNRKFIKPNEYYNYIDIDNIENIKNNTKLFIGPSTDTTNSGATETATVSHIINYINGKRIYLTAPLKYQYAANDPVTFYSHVYVFSSDGYAADNTKGTLFKLDAYSWNTVQTETSAIYKRVTSSRWCPVVNGIAAVINTNILFIKPYDCYQNWRSLFMNNVENDRNTIFKVFDICFDNYTIYKLQKVATIRYDSGERYTFAWEHYNYQTDTLLPYSNSIATWSDKSILAGYYINTDIKLQVRDQYHVGLRDVYVNFYKSGDPNALFDPLDGSLITDTNGEASINYRSGISYDGHTVITTRVTGTSLSTGSGYTWASNNIISHPNTPLIANTIKQLKLKSTIFYLKSIMNKFHKLRYEEPYIIYEQPYTRIMAKSFFTSPSGDWGVNTETTNYFSSTDEIKEWLPMLYRGKGIQLDSIRNYDGCGFTFEGALLFGDISDYYGDIGDDLFLISNRITVVNDFVSDNKIKSLTDFILYHYKDSHGNVEPTVPFKNIKQPSETGRLQLSQLNLSLHTHWVDGKAYDRLFTYGKINQFIFVEDAVPKFWSEKNPVETNIWIRLRPFAFNLNNNTLRIWIREVTIHNDTGYYEVTDRLTLNNFDAGSNLLGIEVLYNPDVNFEYGSLIFVRIEVYDRAYVPNFIYTEYWFKVTPDYKAPYLINLSPIEEEINVPVNTAIHFEIMDIGTGIDISSLECLLNSVRMDPDYLNITIVSKYHIKVDYFPAENLLFSKDYKVSVKVQDISPQENRMNASYTFYTADSSAVAIIEPSPGVCKSGMKKFQDISVKVLADGNGVDASSIRMQVFDKDINPRILPIVYRIA